MKDFKNVVFIADVHIGVKSLDPSEVEKQLELSVIEPLTKINYLDGIVVLGDWFDFNLWVNSESSRIAFNIMGKLKQIVKKFDGFLIVLKGTSSHDNNQLECFTGLMDDIEYYYVPTVDVIETHGMKLLCLPEEHVESPTDYYSSYLDKPELYYDYICGHGYLTEASFYYNDSSEYSRHSVMFNTKKLISICNGSVMFGHIHSHDEYYNGRAMYVGSVFSSSFGDCSQHGFVISSYIKDTGDILNYFYENEHDMCFDTILIDDSKLSVSSIDELISEISENHVDKLKVIFIYIMDDDKHMKVTALKKYLAKNKDIVVEMKGMTKQEYTETIDDDVKQARLRKHQQMKKLTIEEKVQLWILEKKSYKIELDTIRKKLKI